MACFWPRSGKQERSTQVPSFHATCGPDHHSTCARCVPDLGRQYVAIWVVTSLSTTFQQLRACISDTVVFKDCFITGPVKGRENANKINQMLRPMAREGRNKNGDTQESANNIQNLLTK